MIKSNSTNKTEEFLKIGNYRDSIFEIINETKTFISNNNCHSLEVDICGLNMIDATKICILCSTFHFAKYPTGNVKWLVKDETIKKQIQFLKLDNIEIEVKRTKHNYTDCGQTFGRVLSLCR